MFDQRPTGHFRRMSIRTLGIALAVATACNAAACSPAAAQQPITLDDIRELRSTPWLGLSPDGDRLAYLLNTPGASADLWLVPFGGGTHEQLTRDIGVRSVVGWNTGADQLAFIAPDDDGTALWLVQPGGEPRVGCVLPRGARSAAWMGDGVRLTFAARADALQSSAAEASASAGDAVFVCNPRSGTVSQVTARGYHGLEFGWSPQGDRLAVSFQERAGFYESLESDLLLVDVRTGEASPLVTRPGIDRSPLWSPDGREIAFLSGFGHSGLLPNIGVAVIRPGEAIPRDVGAAHDRGGFFESPALHAWSADGRDIFYSVVDGLEVPLFRVPAAGGPWQRVRVPVADGEVAYQYSLSAHAQRLAFKVSATDRPPEIFTMRLGQADVLRVTRFHDGFAVRGATRAESLRWTAPDSTIIEGMLLRPPPSAGDGPFPLVTILHGGPASAYNLSFPSLGFFNPYQDVHLAARGYAVFLPNPRGSGGYGEHFRRAARRDWGDGPAADVHAGIDTLIAMGVADPDRLALTGWSYGGYLAAWMLAHGDRFAVGSVGAGVYDLTTHYGLGAPQLEEYFGGPPWRLPGLYRQQSPIQHVARIRTPTQIIHGERDNAVTIAQSELLHAALLAEGVPTEFVRYPGEGHSLRQAAAQNDSWERMLAWLERWIVTGRQADAGRADMARQTAGDDVATLDGIINAYYDVISGPAGSAPDRARDQRLHHPAALVAITGASRAGTPTIRTMSLDEYHELFGGVRTAGFYEREIHRRVERFGNIAHVWSTYESSREPGGTPFSRGINSIQLYNDGQRWWITSWVFDSERSGNAIPGQYLPGSM
jgi:dipeptidyl aminopeptidase/acylaminoacyl peptidase